MSGRKNLKVSKETFERLSNDKPDGVTWDRYLCEMHKWAKSSTPPYPEEDFSGWRGSIED